MTWKGRTARPGGFLCSLQPLGSHLRPPALARPAASRPTSGQIPSGC